MLAKAFWDDRSGDRVVKYAPGDKISDSHPKRDWLIKSGIAVEEVKASKPTKAKEPAKPKPEPVEDEPVKAASKKPKPTDSAEAHRAYLKARKVETKGLTRAQMIKVIAGLDD